MEARVGSAIDGDPDRSAAPLWLTLVALTFVVVLVALTISALDGRGQAEAEAEARAEAARTALDLRAALTRQLQAVDAGRGDGTGELDAAGVPVGQITGEAALDSAEARTALARARDGGAMVVSAPAADTGAVILVRARYADTEPDPGDGDGPDGGDLTVAERRDGLTGYTASVVDVADLLPADVAGVRRITDGGTVLVPFRDRPGAVAEVDVAVLDRRWVVAAPVAAASTGPVWAVVGLGVLTCAAIVLATLAWRRSDRSRRRIAARANERADAVVTYAGVVQEGHDLGQVVPAIAVQLADRLGLAGVSLSVTSELGRNRDVFTYGDPPDRDVEPTATLPAEVPPGATVALHLRRAERSIGLLRLRCGRELGPADLDQLRIAAELIASTVVTARALEQQQDAVERLRVLDDLKNTFLGTASHELRTPVTAIAGFSFMLSERWDVLSDDDRRTFATRIALNARALEALVQDLLDFARMERGDLKLVLEAVDVGAVADRVIDRLEPVWSTHTIERALGPGCEVTADVAALERTITNLVSNAVKFSPQGSSVRVSVDRDGDDVRLLVDDRGPGVPPDERERIFVRFFRGHGETVLRTSGVGIGLAVVKDFVSQMGGTIDVSDNPEGGARFAVRLPARSSLVDQEARGAATT